MAQFAETDYPILARIGVRHVLRRMISDSSLPITDEARTQLRRHALLPRRIADTADEALALAQSDPEGTAALEADAAPGGTHPFIDWLMANWKQIYNIVRLILAAFGIVLPPIP